MITKLKSILRTSLTNYTQMHLKLTEEYSTHTCTSIVFLILQLTQQWIFILTIQSNFYKFIRIGVSWNLENIYSSIQNAQPQYIVLCILIFEKFLNIYKITESQIGKLSPITPLFPEIVWIPSITLGFIQIYYNAVNKNYTHLVFSIIYVIILIGNALFHYVLLGDTLTIKTRSIRQFQSSQLDYVNIPLNIIQCLIFSQIIYIEKQLQLQASILIILSVIRLYKQHTFEKYVKIELIYTNIIFSSFNFIIGILAFKEYKYSFTLLLLILPFIIFIQIDIIKRQIDMICYNIDSKNIIIIKKYVLMTNNDIQLNAIQLAILSFQHIQQCQSLNCELHDANSLINIKSKYKQYLQYVEQIKIKINFSQYRIAEQQIKHLYGLVNQKQIHIFQLIGILMNFGQIVEAFDLLLHLENPQDIKSFNNNRIKAIIILLKRVHKFKDSHYLYLKRLLRKQILQNIVFTSAFSSEIDIKSFIKNQNKQIEIHQTIKDILLQRIAFYEQLYTQRKTYDYNMEQQIYTLGILIKSLNDTLIHEYSTMPNQQNYNQLLFFQSEVTSNLFQFAKNLKQPILQSDNLPKSHIYMIFEMEQDNYLKLVQKSRNYNQVTMQSIGSFYDIAPTFIQDEHNQLVFEFLKTGKSKYFQQYNQNYIKINSYEIKPIQIYIELVQTSLVSQIQSDGLQFIAFMIENNASLLSFATNTQHQVCNYSSALVQLLKQNGYNFNKLVHIGRIIPQYPNFCAVLEEQRVLNLRDEVLKFDYERRECLYKAELQIQSRKVNNSNYYIVQIFQLDISQLKERPEETTDETKTVMQIPNNNYKNHSKNLKFSQIILTSNLITDRIDYLEQPLMISNEYDNGNTLTQNYNQQQDTRQPILDVLPGISELEYSRQVSEHPSEIQDIQDTKPYTKSMHNQRLIDLKYPSSIIKTAMIKSLSLILCITYAVIVITVVNPDLNIFVQEIDMIGLHASFMGPYDLFFSQRASMTNYQNYQKAGVISLAQFQYIYPPLIANINNDFNDCYVSEYAVLESKTLRSFFIDQSLTAYFMKDNSTQIYPISMSFQVVLQVLVANLVYFRQIYLAGGTSVGSTYYTFQYANYLNIHEKLENLTLEIQSYSTNRAQNISTKQIIIQIVFLVLNLLLIIYLVYLHFQQDNLNKKFVQLFAIVQIKEIEVELKRLSNLYQEINNIDIINYKFDPKSIIQQQQYNNIRNTNSKQFLQILKSNKFIIHNILTQTIIYSFFIIFSLIINIMAQQFIQSYIDTVPFYKLVQDLKFRGGLGYLYREIYLRWSFFPYLSEKDRIRLDGLYYESISVQEQYLALSGGLNYSQNLLSNEFIQFWEQSRSEPLCQFVPEQYMGFLYRYCNISLSGTLNGGLVSALSYAINDLQTQREINNFTVRVDYELYEQEGAQIITRVFFQMSDLLKSGMQDITAHYIMIIQVITIIFIILCVFAIYYIIKIRYRNLQIKHDIVKRCLYLLPRSTIYHSDALEREVIRLYYQLSKS